MSFCEIVVFIEVSACPVIISETIFSCIWLIRRNCFLLYFVLVLEQSCIILYLCTHICLVHSMVLCGSRMIPCLTLNNELILANKKWHYCNLFDFSFYKISYKISAESQSFYKVVAKFKPIYYLILIEHVPQTDIHQTIQMET